MKQKRFAFVRERFKELPVVLEEKIEDKLVICMAEAIIEVFKKRERGKDDRI